MIMFKSQSYENDLNSQQTEADFLNLIFGQQHNTKSDFFFGSENGICNEKKLSSFKEWGVDSHQLNEDHIEPYYGMTDNLVVSGQKNDRIHECWEPGEILNEAEDDIVFDFRRAISEPGTPQKDSVLARDYFDSRSITSEWTPRRPGKKRGPRPKKLTNEEKRQKRRDANNRERQRMGQLNYAFDNLRHLLPKHGNDRELSKFETIQIAKNYIKALNDMISWSDAKRSDFSHSELSPGLDFS